MGSWSSKTRLHQITGKILHLYEVAGWWYMAYDGREVARSQWYPDVHRMFDHFEFKGVAA